MRHRKLAIAGGGVLGLAALALLFLLLFDFKSFAERRATAALGHPVTIGALELSIFPLEVELGDLLVADVPAGQPIPADRPPFMKAEYVDAVIGFWRLLAGEVLFKRLTVENAVARVERRPDGSLTWQVENPNAGKAEIATAPLRCPH